jgi:PBP1b-binding outer membrane lipoprotein LpoB
MRMLGLFLTAAILLAGCSNEPDYTDQQRACIAKLYKDYDAKRLSQCVGVCKSCMGGNATTCTTSCNLKGAR